ncbi:flagellar biosynthesis protein FliQ [Rubeoparvulum massiliense]|uniref:flagellar biosynthesis protein FliQ n=1 Tax=Rubeoparvulum massiliense TaxID=1631346 RepID=UPI00065E0EB1|nr:flagellar biosynthesis protein FliQ [Rubeoparvulum massiliense]
MTEEFIIHLSENAVYTILLVTAPALGVGLLVGLLVSIFQATTQIQEQTLAFIPKIVAILVTIVLTAPWMLTKLIDFTHMLLDNLHQFVR